MAGKFVLDMMSHLKLRNKIFTAWERDPKQNDHFYPFGNYKNNLFKEIK